MPIGNHDDNNPYSMDNTNLKGHTAGNNATTTINITTTRITSNKRVHHNVKGFFRLNFLLLTYVVLRVIIIFATIVLALSAIQYDLFAIIASLGLITLISIIHLGDFFRNFFAYIWILATNQVRRGDLISMSGLGSHGCVLDFTSTHTIIRCVGKLSSKNPHAGKWDEFIPNSYFFVTPFTIYDELEHDYTAAAVAGENNNN